MADGMTREDRDLIDAALAEGKVTICPPRRSAMCHMRHRETGQLVWVNALQLQRDGRSRVGLKGWVNAEDLVPLDDAQRLHPALATPQELADARQDRVRILHGEGLVPSEIAQRLGCGAGTVRNDLAAMGLRPNLSDPVAQQRAEKAARQKKVREYKRCKVSNTAIAKALGVSRATITSDVRELQERGEL